MSKRLGKWLCALGLLVAFASSGFAAAITPDSTYQERTGSCRLVIANFSAGTADDGDTWASGLTRGVVSFWTQDTDDPDTQASVGVAAARSAGTFTFYPAEDNKPFYLFVLLRS